MHDRESRAKVRELKGTPNRRLALKRKDKKKMKMYVVNYLFSGKSSYIYDFNIFD